MTPETNGRPLPPPFAWLNPDGAYWKTSQGCLLPDTSETYLQTWPRSGFQRAGVCYPQPALEPRTAGSVSGSLPTTPGTEPARQAPLWPTPTSSASNSCSMQAAAKEARRLHPQGRATLATKVAETLWPTPTTDSATKRRKRYAQGGMPLQLAVELVPTPTVDDADNSTLPPSQVTRDNLPGHLLRHGHKTGGELNPEWVEWLMGWPIGWTACEPLEMDRFRQWWHAHGDYWAAPTHAE